MGPTQNGASSQTFPRPKSTSALPISSNPRNAPPYMIALSGWPEPVYIAHDPSSWPSRRSRPSSPGPAVNDGEVRDGIGVSLPPLNGKAAQTCPAVPQESIWSRKCMYGEECRVPGHPDHVLHDGGYYVPGVKHAGQSRTRTPRGSFDDGRSAPLSMSRQARADKEASPFPTSSARSSVSSPTQPLPPPRQTRFADPRLMPNVAVLSNRPALAIAPSWSTSASSSPYPTRKPPVGTGVKVTAGSRGAGLLIMRSTSDVYPPPSAPPPPPGLAGMAVQMTGVSGMGMATEVYPRDPDSVILWGGVNENLKSREDSGEEEDGMEMDNQE
ncbi:hypothetical protein BCR39DRAFT_548477 [Naematelia encephala]|uniref:Uncharacterized protein n=1 Tax=Naematelia encephala TaxID=71784 RepID=A0A1Y2AML4_9TREE|nr:hypothetical protein BCR39DRAFT_548477 [Naematelia encephala]